MIDKSNVCALCLCKGLKQAEKEKRVFKEVLERLVRLEEAHVMMIAEYFNRHVNTAGEEESIGDCVEGKGIESVESWRNWFSETGWPWQEHSN